MAHVLFEGYGGDHALAKDGSEVMQSSELHDHLQVEKEVHVEHPVSFL